MRFFLERGRYIKEDMFYGRSANDHHRARMTIMWVDITWVEKKDEWLILSTNDIMNVPIKKIDFTLLEYNLGVMVKSESELSKMNI